MDVAASPQPPTRVAPVRTAPLLVATVIALAATAGLGARAVDRVRPAFGPDARGVDAVLRTARVEDAVEVTALIVGTLLALWFTVSLAAAVLCLGARAAGRRWVAGERLVAATAPAVVRRLLVLAAGTGVALAGAGLPAGATSAPPPTDLGWSPTVSATPWTTVIPGAPSAAPASGAAPSDGARAASPSAAPGPALSPTPAAAAPIPATAVPPTGPEGHDVAPPAATADGLTTDGPTTDGTTSPPPPTAPTGDTAAPGTSSDPGPPPPATPPAAPSSPVAPSAAPPHAVPSSPAASPATPAATPTAAPVPTVPGGAAPTTAIAPVTVRRGDTLWGIAAEHLPAGASVADIAAAWPAWYAANVDVVGADPGHIVPGQVLRPPASAATASRGSTDAVRR